MRQTQHILSLNMNTSMEMKFIQMINIAAYSPSTICLFQNEHAEHGPWDPDPDAHASDDSELLPHVDLHDIQRLAVHSSDLRGRLGLFPLWLAQVCGCGHHRTLPLAPLPVCVLKIRVVKWW